MGNRRQQRVVREGQFNRAVHGIEDIMAANTAVSIAKYDRDFVSPMREWVQYLILPWWRRIFTPRPDVELVMWAAPELDKEPELEDDGEEPDGGEDDSRPD